MQVYGLIVAFFAFIARLSHAQQAGCPGSTGPTATDLAVLKFALNLECLESSYYSLVAYGMDKTQTMRDGTNYTTLYPSKIKPVKSKLAKEIADDEISHVALLRSAGITIPCPNIDLSADLWNALAQAVAQTHGKKDYKKAKVNPYSDKGWLVGAFLFEDVGVSAYLGAAGLIDNRATVLSNAGAILSTEAYHAGAIRRVFLDNHKKKVPGMLGMNLGDIADAIQTIRASLGNGGESLLLERGTNGKYNGTENNINADNNGEAFPRSYKDVLKIVYGTGAFGTSTGGLFYPNGFTGDLTSAA